MPDQNGIFDLPSLIMKPYNHTDEKELLLRLRDGDGKAFEQIFQQFQPALVFFANRLLHKKNLLDAEEVVQDTFMKLYERRVSFSTLQNIKAFLYITTKNSCLQQIEKEQVRLRRFEKFVNVFEQTEDVILQEIIYAEVIREVSMAIELLPEQCRNVMKRFFEEGMSAKEIAEELDITVSTVNNQKSRAISILKQRLSGAGIALLIIHL